MSESEQTDAGGQQYDAPNQEVVGVGHPSQEGSGGSGGEVSPHEGEPTHLDDMTKEQLLEHAQTLGVKPANAAMTKEEIRAGIDAHQSTVQQSTEVRE